MRAQHSTTSPAWDEMTTASWDGSPDSSPLPCPSSTSGSPSSLPSQVPCCEGRDAAMDPMILDANWRVLPPPRWPSAPPSVEPCPSACWFAACRASRKRQVRMLVRLSCGNVKFPRVLHGQAAATYGSVKAVTTLTGSRALTTYKAGGAL